MGMQFLMKGQLNDALSHYHLAVENDRHNYLTYFKRSTVYQAMGRYRSALEDLTESLKLNSQFLPARVQRASILYRQGSLDEAQKEYEYILHSEPHHNEALLFYSQIDAIRNDWHIADHLVEINRCHEAIEILSKLVQEIYWSYELKESRAKCFEKTGDIINAINDLRSLTKMKPDNTDGYLKLSKLHYLIGEPEESLNAIRECLKLDPDHKSCHQHYKNVKKLAGLYKSATELASKHDHEGCINKLKAALKLENDTTSIVYLLKSKLCHCLNLNGNAQEAIDTCTEALELHPDDPNVLCDRADAHINLENYDDASRDYKKASQIDENSTRPKDGYQKAERLKKQSKKKDYYKILGVPRNAQKKDIMKAYRKAASKWHPDQYQGDEKKKAEKMFIDIAAAKEVLTDPEKRQKFDNGEDPLDPEQQNGNAFHPFTRGFDPFGGQYTFRFTF